MLMCALTFVSSISIRRDKKYFPKSFDCQDSMADIFVIFGAANTDDLSFHHSYTQSTTNNSFSLNERVQWKLRSRRPESPPRSGRF